jgi:hypothetical protein
LSEVKDENEGRKMAHLSVNSRILKYKDTSYQISQMTSVMPVTIKRKKKIAYVDLAFLKFFVPAGLFSVLFGIAIFSNSFIWGVSITLAGILSLRYCYQQWQARRAQDSLETHYLMHGISLRMSNADKQFFVSSDKSLIMEVHDAIIEAMNGVEGVSITFENANIEISDSENVTIGSVNNG